MRPEIIIPYEQSALKDIDESDEEAYLSQGLIPGTVIRLIREPYFGMLGEVVNLPVELQELQTESKARVLDVKLEDGRTVTVPRANVEIIEE